MRTCSPPPVSVMWFVDLVVKETVSPNATAFPNFDFVESAKSRPEMGPGPWERWSTLSELCPS